jgi:hypothetical protein
MTSHLSIKKQQENNYNIFREYIEANEDLTALDAIHSNLDRYTYIKLDSFDNAQMRLEKYLQIAKEEFPADISDYSLDQMNVYNLFSTGYSPERCKELFKINNSEYIQNNIICSIICGKILEDLTSL